VVSFVSYDIYFVRRDPGQSFEDALDDIEDAFEGDPGPLTPVELEQWDEVLSVARDVFADVEEFGDEMTRELVDPDTGIQVSLFNGEVAIRVPYGEGGAGSADEVMAKVYELARGIERATGLEGYDPQLEEPVSDVRAAGVASARTGTTTWDEDDEPTGTSVTVPSPAAPRREPEPAAAVSHDGGPRWWEFWKR
jgi:hypothetical protein